MRVPVSSAIDKEDFERWKRSGMRLAHVIKLGLMAAEQTPGYLNRIRELEEGNERLQRRLSQIAQQMNGGA
jgi:hypothetical protein